jgi:branched-chain amino acid transport system ATP-binding protein
MSILVVNDLQANHGLLAAVRGVSFSIEQGEVLAVVGANGAGKTTLFRTLCGVHRAHAGQIHLANKDITDFSAHHRVSEGLAMVPEGRRLFADMSVRENLLIAGEHGRLGEWSLERVVDALPALRSIMSKLAGGLSGGQRQSVAIGRALMSNPKVLMLDEVSLGLSPIAVDEVYESLQQIKEAGQTTMVLVEQDLNRARQFSDRLMCLLEGQISLQGTADTLSKEAIVAAYFGLEKDDGLEESGGLGENKYA